MDTKAILKQIYLASPKELSDVLTKMNEDCFRENEWCDIAVKAEYRLFLVDINQAINECQMMLNFRNYNPFVWDNETHEEWRYDTQQALANLGVAKEFLSNPPIPENQSKSKNNQRIENIDWNKPVFTLKELCTAFNVCENTMRKWMDAGWFGQIRMDGSAPFVSKEDLEKFLHNDTIYYPPTK